MRRSVQFLLVAMLAVLPAHGKRPLTVSDLMRNPSRYDRQVVEISAFVSHGFEDFTFVELGSDSDASIWIEYGGTVTSETLYCCGLAADRQRETALRIDDIETNLVQDELFRAFDQIIQTEPETIIHATLRGRFFAGEELVLPGGKRRAGYGHFGLYSLFVIEQVLSVDHSDIRNVDFNTIGDAPHFDDPSCYAMTAPRVDHLQAIALQKRAETADLAWTFTDPERAVRLRLAESFGSPIRVLRTVSSSPSRIVYEISVSGKSTRYWATVSRPYWLTFFAARPDRVAWTVLGVTEAECQQSGDVPAA